MRNYSATAKHFSVPDPDVTVDQLWVLVLCLKALLKSLQSGGSEAVPGIFQAQFVKCVVALAGQGTGFCRQWLLRDLEVGEAV